MDARLQESSILVACDVSNPLCGTEGASAVYGPQKGATPAMVAELDAALAHYAAVLLRDLGKEVRDVPGAGAAGGLGAGLLAFLNATLTPGAPLILDAMRFDEHLGGAALVFTAEGRLDEQTAYGKAVAGVAGRAHAQQVPVIALAGSLGAGAEALSQIGIDALVPLPDGPLSLEHAMERTETLLADAAERAARLIAIGMLEHSGTS